MSFIALARNTGYAFGENRLTLVAVSSWRCWRSAPSSDLTSRRTIR